jgi:hypothetical protein
MATTTQVSPKPGSESSTARTRTPVTARPRTLKHEDIAALAHSLYVESGYQGGREVEFWLEAERRLREDLDA